MVAVKKKKKPKKQDDSAAKTLEELQGRSDDLAEWIGDNPIPILATGVIVLVVAAGIGFLSSYQDDQKLEASRALSEVRADYRSAMGALPTDLDIPEPANPETARQTRLEHIDRFKQVAAEYDGELAGSMALLEAGSLEEQLEDREAAITTWRGALEGLPQNSALRAILLSRIAGAQEALGDYGAAAASYRDASEVNAYPLRYVALVNAARCLAEVGDVEGALAAYERVELESPDLRVPAHTAARLRELRASQSL